MKKLVVVDVMYLTFRAFHATRSDHLRTSSGFPTNAIFGVVNLCLKMLREEKPDYLAFCMDSPTKTFRHALSPTYKHNRTPIPSDLTLQFPVLFRFLETFNVPVLQRPGFEADDIIGSMACKFSSPSLQVSILSKDKDFMQLINDHIKVLKIDKDLGFSLIDTEKMIELVGVRPDQMVDYLAIVGDTSDNIQGVKGIGAKGAVALLKQFPNLETILQGISQVKSARHQHLLQEFVSSTEDVTLGKQLVRIVQDLPLDYKLEDFKVKSVEDVTQDAQLIAMCRELEFASLLKRYIK